MLSFTTKESQVFNMYGGVKFSIRIEMYIQSCTDTRFFSQPNFILVGNSSLKKRMSAPWWLLQCVFSWKRLMLGWQ